MRTRLLFLFALIASLFMFCSKDENGGDKTPTEPSNGGNGGEFSSFTITKHRIMTELPSNVSLQFQVSNKAQSQGADFLKLEDFQVIEEGTTLDPTEASMYIIKRQSLDYKAKITLMLDTNNGTNLDAIKNGVTEFIDTKDPQQDIAIYSFADEITLVQDFTSNASTLKDAVSGLETSGDGSDLYGAYMDAIRSASSQYGPNTIQQPFIIVFTDNKDTKGSYQADFVGHAGRGRQIMSVGIGNNINTENLEKIGYEGLYHVTDPAKITETISELQSRIIKWMDSFYYLSYTSKQRRGSSHSIQLKIKGNLNTDEDSIIKGIFSSQNFVDVEQGLYVNWSFANPQGVDMILVMVDKSREVEALSMGGTKVPDYEWSSEDANVVAVQARGGGRALLKAKGSDGDSTHVTVKDVANGFEKIFTVQVVSFQMGSILFEWWDNLSGTSVSDLTNSDRFPDNPTGKDYLESFEIPTDKKDNYATRLRGFLHPATTGEYTFWIASDDASRLYLSTDENPENKTDICYVSSWTSSREWNKETNQKSAPIQLEAGKHYYIEALHKEGGGGDNLAVAWALGDGDKEVISGEYLSAWIGD